MQDISTIPLQTLEGETTSLAAWRGQVILIVNVASRCGFTPQYTGLEALYQRYREQGMVILGFPCNQFGQQEPGNAEEIRRFCQLDYPVSFPLFARCDVNGANAHPLYRELKKAKRGLLWTPAIKWNFTKFLINREGKVVARFAPFVKPETLENAVRHLLT